MALKRSKLDLYDEQQEGVGGGGSSGARVKENDLLFTIEFWT